MCLCSLCVTINDFLLYHCISKNRDKHMSTLLFFWNMRIIFFSGVKDINEKSDVYMYK